MALSTTGDMRQYLLTTRHNTFLKNDLNTLVEELTTGEMSDLTAHLGGAQTNLAGIDRQLQMLAQYSRANTETGQLLSAMQTALTNVDKLRQKASDTLLTIDATSLQAQVSDASIVALSNFESVIQSLNLRSGARAAFGGPELDNNPLGNADEIINALRTEVSGLATAADIEDAIDAWFDLPGGGFETIGYEGSQTDYVTRSTGANETVTISVRADDKAFRDTLKSLAKGALAADPTLSLDPSVQRELQTKAGIDLLANASSLASTQARLGYVEGQADEAAVRTAAQASSFGIARNDLVSADPFETASRLQSVQLQLETHYTLTARLSRLSLTEYLR